MTTEGGAVEAAIEAAQGAAHDWEEAVHKVNDRGYPPGHEMKAWFAFCTKLEAIAQAAQEEAERERDAARVAGQIEELENFRNLPCPQCNCGTVDRRLANAKRMLRILREQPTDTAEATR